MSDELKPCPNPWCDYNEPRVKKAVQRNGDHTLHFVQCECDIESPYAPTEAEAIAAWNRRTPDPTRHADLIARLGREADHLRRCDHEDSADLLDEARVALGGEG